MNKKLGKKIVSVFVALVVLISLLTIMIYKYNPAPGSTITKTGILILKLQGKNITTKKDPFATKDGVVWIYDLKSTEEALNANPDYYQYMLIVSTEELADAIETAKKYEKITSIKTENNVYYSKQTNFKEGVIWRND